MSRPWFRQTKPPIVQKLLRSLSQHEVYLRAVARGRASLNVVREGTDLTVEGFPRSGNTFAVAKLHAKNPELVIAHHLHSASQVRRSVKFGLPTLILFREPIDSLASWLQREPDLDLQSAAKLYLNFYAEVLSERQSVVLSDFTQTVGSFEDRVGILNARFGTRFEVSSDLAARQLISARSLSKGNHVEYLHGSRVNLRKSQLDVLKSHVSSQVKCRGELEAIYSSLKVINNAQA